MQQGATTVGEINAVTITRDMLRLYGQHAFTVVGTSALIQGVALVVSFLAFNAFGLAGMLVWVVALVVATQLSMGVYTKLLLHLRHGHEMPSPGYLVKEAAPHLLPLIWLGVLVGVGTTIAFLLFIAPGIYLALRWAVAAPALVAKQTSATEALRLSAEATQGHKGTVFAVVVISYFFSNGLPQLIQRGNPTMAMENIFIAQAVIATLATPIVALATAELFLRLARVPNRIVPGAPLGGPAPAPAGPFVPTAAIPAQHAVVPAQPAPGPYVPQPAPGAGFMPAPLHAAAPAHHVPLAHYAPAAPPVGAPPQHHAPPSPAPAAAYVPPPIGSAPPMRQGPSVAPPGLG